MDIDSILDTIYKENPSHWPYGLYKEGFDHIYVVRDNMTKQAAGFTGWQFGYLDDFPGQKLGLYSIGLLPEFRGKGLAKEAVAKIVKAHGDNCDKVVAYIVESNEPSKRLAESLGIPYVTET